MVLLSAAADNKIAIVAARCATARSAACVAVGGRTKVGGGGTGDLICAWHARAGCCAGYWPHRAFFSLGGACTTRVRPLDASKITIVADGAVRATAHRASRVAVDRSAAPRGGGGHVAMRGACSRCSRRSMLADDVSLCGGVDADQVTIAAAGAVPLLIALLASPSTDVQKVAAEEPRCQRQRVRSGGRVML